MFTSIERIKPDAQSIALYLENLLSNKYQIPTFQQYVVWEKENSTVIEVVYPEQYYHFMQTKSRKIGQNLIEIFCLMFIIC